MKSIQLGQTISNTTQVLHPQINYHEQAFRSHIGRPWFNAYLARQIGLQTITSEDTISGTSVAVENSMLERHSTICGSSGGGKSRLMEHVILEHLRQGCSAVVIDPKSETISAVLAGACTMGFSPDQITLIDPRQSNGIPGWNPFLVDIPPAQIVGDLVSVIRKSSLSWGVRLGDVLSSVLHVLLSQNLSIYETARFLTRDEYRERLLQKTVSPKDPLAYSEACSFFTDEFAAWSRSEKAQAVSPVLNKIRELLRSRYLQPLLCARENTMELSTLWQKPSLVLVHLDRVSLGDEGARLLAGLVTTMLYRTALSHSGAVPVLLALDELATVEQFVGSALVDILTTARSKNLRVVAAFQHLAQLSDELRTALLANTALQAYFRLGYADARLAAASLSAGAPSRITRLSVGKEKLDNKAGAPAYTRWRHPIRDESGRILRLQVVSRFSVYGGLLGSCCLGLLKWCLRNGWLIRCFGRLNQILSSSSSLP